MEKLGWLVKVVLGVGVVGVVGTGCGNAGSNGGGTKAASSSAPTSSRVGSSGTPATIAGNVASGGSSTTTQPWYGSTSAIPVAPSSSNPNVLVVAPDDPEMLFVLGFETFAVSSDGGNNWQDLSAALGFPAPSSNLFAAAGALAFDPFDATHAIVGAQNPSGRLFETHDHGASWRELTGFAASLDVSSFTAIVFDPKLQGTIYACAQEAASSGLPGAPQTTATILRKSLDGGQTWTDLDPTLPWTTALAIDPVTTTTLFAATAATGLPGYPAGGLYKSTDGGQSWALVGGSFFDGNSFAGGVAGSIAVDPKSSQNVFAAGRRPGGSGGSIGKSIDGGTTWSEVEPASAGADGFSQVLVDSKTPATLYATGTSTNVPVLLLKSTDGGTTWSSIASGLSASQNDTPIVLALAPSDPLSLYASIGSKLFSSGTGGQ